MTTFLIFVVAGIGWLLWRTRARVHALEQELQSAIVGTASNTHVRELTERVRTLEEAATPIAAPPAPTLAAPVAKPVPAPAPAFIRVERTAPISSVISPPDPPAPRRDEPPTPSLVDRVRGILSNQEWELLVGGNLLNKLGALVLVIGIALFLGYSFGHLTPGGRAAIAVTLSVTLLGAGIRLENKLRYRMFGRGLIGAGWAALYATSYAVYAIPAARVIADPFAGSIVVMVVASGMILHSLRYRSQAVTGVAYFAAFAAMAVTPSSPLAVIGLIPLAASLLYLAWRFQWHSMVVFGLAATYLTCLSRGSSGATLAVTQSLFLAYWLLFEIFDLLRVKHQLVTGGLDLLFPLNTLCFVGLSYLTWSTHQPDNLWLASGFAAALFLADSLARAIVRPPTSFPEDTDLLERLRAGSFEGAFLISAVMAGLAVVGRVPGVWAGAGLAAEAELVYLAGLRLRSPFLRNMGARAFILSVLKILGSPDASGKTLLFGWHSTWNWAPPLLFNAALLYTNRALRQPNALMSWCATLIVATVLAAELPIAVLGTALVLFGILLLELWLRRKSMEFRVQSRFVLAGGVFFTAIGIAERTEWRPQAISLALLYACAIRTKWMHETEPEEGANFSLGVSAATALVAALLAWRLAPPEYLALVWFSLSLVLLELGGKRLPSQLRMFFAPVALLATAALATDLNSIAKFPPLSVWVTYLSVCVGFAATAARLTLRPPAEAANWERTVLRDALAALACAAALIGVWMVIPDATVTIAWTAIAIAVLEAGIALRVPSFRVIALTTLPAVYWRLLIFDLRNPGFDGTTLAAGLTAIAGIYWIWHRSSNAREAFDPISRLQFWSALLPVTLLIGQQLGIHNAPLGWATVAIVLLILGIRSQIRDAILQSVAMAALAFAGALWFDISPLRLSLCISTAAVLYAAQFVSKRATDRAPEWVAVSFSLGGTLLLAAMLYGQSTGGLLTVSWGALGLVLLSCGFALRERVLRVQGLGILLVCILKLFLYDLRNLETVYRILSFVVLGFILLGVSWIYTRFRENVRKLL